MSLTIEKLVNSYCFDFIKAVDELIIIFPDESEILELEDVEKIPYKYKEIPVIGFEFSVRSHEKKDRKRYIFFIETR